MEGGVGRYGSISGLLAWEVTCQGFLQLVSVIGALQQTSQGNDDVFKAWPLRSIFAPAILQQTSRVKRRANHHVYLVITPRPLIPSEGTRPGDGWPNHTGRWKD